MPTTCSNCRIQREGSTDSQRMYAAGLRASVDTAAAAAKRISRRIHDLLKPRSSKPRFKNLVLPSQPTQFGVTSVFRRALLGCCTAQVGSWLQTFRNNIQGSSSQRRIPWKPFTMAPTLPRNVHNQPSPTYAVQHSRRTKTITKTNWFLQFRQTLLYESKWAHKVFDRWDTLEMKHDVLKLVIMKWWSSVLQYHVVL
jgi:hypothetical protein